MEEPVKKNPLKPDGAIRIPVSLEGNFFLRWLEFLEPVHKLTKRETELFAALLQARYELSKVILDDDLLDKLVMGTDTKLKIMEKCGFSAAHYQAILGSLRKNKMLFNEKINKKFIPQLSQDAKEFKYLLLFDINESK